MPYAISKVALNLSDRDILVFFGPGIKFLQQTILNIQSQYQDNQPSDYLARQIVTGADPSIQQILGHVSGRIRAGVIEDVVGYLQQYYRSRQSPDVAKINKMRDNLMQVVQQTKEKEQQSYISNLKVTHFKLVHETTHQKNFAISWSSHLPEVPRGYFRTTDDNVIRNQILAAFGPQSLVRDKQNFPDHWLLVQFEATDQNFELLKTIFANNGYDTQAIDAERERIRKGEAEATNRGVGTTVVFENATEYSSFQLAVQMDQFKNRPDLHDLFLETVEMAFPLQERGLGQPAKGRKVSVSATQAAKYRDNNPEKLAQIREKLLAPAGSMYYDKGKDTLYIKGTYNNYINLKGLMITRNFDPTNLHGKVFMRGSELFKSNHLERLGTVQRPVGNGIVDGYYIVTTGKGGKRRGHYKLESGWTAAIYQADTEKFDGEVYEYHVQKPGQDPYQLYPLQVTDVRWLYSRTSAMLGDETGVGKTEQLVAAADMRTKDKNHWREGYATGRVLIFTIRTVVDQFADRISQVTGYPREQIATRFEQIGPDTKWAVLSYGLLNAMTTAQAEAAMARSNNSEEDYLESDEMVDPMMDSVRSNRRRQQIVDERMQTLRQLNFDVMILDESHKVKNANANTSRNIAQLGSNVPFKWEASATVSANEPADIHHQLYAAGHPLGSMDNRHFRMQYTGASYKDIRGATVRGDPSSARAFLDVVRSLRSDFDGLPLDQKKAVAVEIARNTPHPEADGHQTLRDIIFSQIARITDLSAMLTLTQVYQRKTKKQVKESRGEEMVQQHTEDHFINTNDEIRNFLTTDVDQRLQQLLARKRENGETVNPDEPFQAITIHQKYMEAMAAYKVPMSVNLARQLIGKGERVLLFTKWREAAQLLYDQLQEAGVSCFMSMGGDPEKGNKVKKFKEDESIKAYVLMIESSAEGLDMPNVVRHVIANDITWVPKDLDQLEGRAYRLNSEQDVTTHYITLNSTPDEVMYKTVQKKRHLADTIQQIDEEYTDRIRNNESIDEQLLNVQEKHWALVEEQILAEIEVQHYWRDQRRMVAASSGIRFQKEGNWLQQISPYLE